MPNYSKIVGGLGQAAKRMLKPADEVAEYRPGVHYADPIKPATMRMSEALGNAGAEGKTLIFTEADRSRVAGENRGGVGFSGLQHYSEPHKDANTVWGFGNRATTNKKINANDPESTIWTTYVGSANQHKSNLVVLNKSLDKFHDAVAGNKVHPAQIRLMNAKLQSLVNKKGEQVFDDAIDLTDPDVMAQLNTFDKRSMVADVLMGIGVKKPMRSKAFKDEFGPQPWGDAGKMGAILRRATDPDLLDAKTFDVGNRLFTMDNGVIHRPDLNAAFPYQVTGDDLGMKYNMTPHDVAIRDWAKQYEGRVDKNGRPVNVGPKDLSMNNPSQLVDEDYLTHLQKAGFKDGGSVDIDAADARLEAAMGQRMAGGGKAEAVKGVYKGFKRLFTDSDAVMPSSRRALDTEGGDKIFIGPNAKTWDAGGAGRAVQMEQAGQTPKDIWTSTGTFRGPGGDLRQEINDRPAKFFDKAGIKDKADTAAANVIRNKAAVKSSLADEKVHPDMFPKESVAARKQLRDQTKVDEQQLDANFGLRSTSGNSAPIAYEHEQLYKAYPELRGTVVRQGEKGAPGLLGTQQGQRIEITAEGMKGDPRSTMTHELQHGVQDIENFPRGGSLDQFTNELMTQYMFINRRIEMLNKQLSENVGKPEYGAIMETKLGLVKELQDLGVTDQASLAKKSQSMYKNLAGEAEARAVQQRIDMTPQERVANFPLDSYDVDPKKLLMRDQYGKEMGEAVEGYGIGGIIKDAAKRAKGFYSAVDNAAAGLKRPMGTGAEFMAEIKATPGVKLTEIKSRKLAELQALPKMPKAQFIKELEARPPVKIEEKVLAGPTQKEVDELADQLAYQKGLDEAREFSSRGDDIDAMTEANYRLAIKHEWSDLQDQARETLKETKGGPFHESYTLPGGENYREILLKNPAAKGAGYPGKAEHFGGEPNILASIRVSDRTAKSATGEPLKILHVEEIQSDLHQHARKLQNNEIKRLMATGMTKEEAVAAVPDDFVYGQLGGDAPFKKDWQELAMKKVMQEAVDGGYDKVVLTKGADQAERYDLSAQVSRLEWRTAGDESTRLLAYDRDGNNVYSSYMSPRGLANYVGDDVANKLMSSPVAHQTERGDDIRQLSGLDINAGGQGMEAFYDKMLPDYMNKLGKPYGIKVEPYDLMKPDAEIVRANAARSFGEDSDAYRQAMSNQTTPVHGFDVSPQMRQDITGKGLPLYQQVGIPAGAAGAEFMEPEQPVEGMAEGGAAFKTLKFQEPQHFDGGGLGVSEDSSGYDPKPYDWRKINANMADARKDAKQELGRLTNPETLRQYAKVLAAQTLGTVPDLTQLAIQYGNPLEMLPGAKLLKTGLTGTGVLDKPGYRSVLEPYGSQTIPRIKYAPPREPLGLAKALQNENGDALFGVEDLIKRQQEAGKMYGETVYARDDDGSFALDDSGQKIKLYQTGRFSPLMEMAGSLASGAGLTKLAKGATKAVEGFGKGFDRSYARAMSRNQPPFLNELGHDSTLDKQPVKLLGQQPEVKTAMTGTPQGSYATRQNGPFYEVNHPDVGGAKTRGVREADELQGQTPVGGGAGQVRGEVASRIPDEEVAGVIASPEKNQPLQIAQRYTKESRGADFAVPSIPESSLAKQSAVGRAHQLAVEGSPEYKSAVFEAYGREMPEMLEQSGAKSYDDLMTKAYRQLAKETDDQFKQLPYNFSYHRAGEGDYANSKEMLADVHGNKHLYVFQGGDPHDFLNQVDKATGLNENEKFRAVHDLLGHAVYGNSFGPKGEEMAYAVHQQMYSPLARLAMAAETRGQNSLVNYSPLNARVKAVIAKLDDVLVEATRRGDTALVAEIQAAKRQEYAKDFKFAPQKAVLLPPEMIDPKYAGGMPDYLSAANRFEKGTETESVLTHFSNTPNLQSIDPARYGTGIKGAEAERLQTGAGGVKDRSYFYMGEPGAVTPESGLGVNRYRGESKGLYDIAADPQSFRTLAREANRTPYTSRYNAGVTSPLQEANDFERMVKEYGYEGMANPKSGKPMAIMFKPTQVEARKHGGLTQLKTR